jgi:hypothetical protein
MNEAAGTTGLGLDAVDLVARHASSATTFEQLRTQRERVDPAAGGRRLDGDAEVRGAVLIHLSLGDTLRESLSVSPMDMDVGVRT